MAGRKQTIEDRINKAEAVVIKAKEKYEAALEDLNRLERLSFLPGRGRGDSTKDPEEQQAGDS